MGWSMLVILGTKDFQVGSDCTNGVKGEIECRVSEAMHFYSVHTSGSSSDQVTAPDEPNSKTLAQVPAPATTRDKS